MSFYDLLGIDKNATKEEIKVAYKCLVKKYHPDINKSVDVSIIKNLNEAREILLDDDRRREYDLSLNILYESREFSRDKSETYSYRKKEYKENYSESYVTRWQFFLSYFKNSVDNVFKKIIKSFLVGINYLIFLIVKMICYVFVYLCFFMQEFIDFIAILLVLIAFLKLFILNDNSQFGVFSFIPLNVQNFCVFISLAGLFEFVKLFVLYGNFNIFKLLNKVYDKLLVWILTKL